MTPPEHGGTDADPPPRFDFSTNANALGPDPVTLAAVRAVDPSGYPDPAYTGLRGTWEPGTTATPRRSSSAQAPAS